MLSSFRLITILNINKYFSHITKTNNKLKTTLRIFFLISLEPNKNKNAEAEGEEDD